MRQRTRDRITLALLVVMVAALAGAIAVLAMDNGGRRAMGGPPAVDVVGVSTEEAFCDLLSAGVTDQRFGAALADSADPTHRRLAEWAGEWGRTGDQVARMRALTECGRLGLLHG